MNNFFSFKFAKKFVEKRFTKSFIIRKDSQSVNILREKVKIRAWNVVVLFSFNLMDTFCENKRSVYVCVNMEKINYIYAINIHVADTEIFISKRRDCNTSTNIYINNDNIHSILNN